MYAVYGMAFPAIHIPNDTQAFETALLTGNSWWPYEYATDDNSATPQHLCRYMTPSSQGQYLSGVIGLFDGFEHVREILLNNLWTQLLEKTGASSKTTELWNR